MSEEQGEGRCDFFVSYTGADVAWVEWIAWQLRAAGYTVRIQAWHSRPGMNFVALMGQALDACERMIAVVSQAYLNQSTYGNDEWTAAFMYDWIRSNLLLVLVEQVTLPRLLDRWIHLYLSGLEPDEAATRLLDGVRLGRSSRPRRRPSLAMSYRQQAGGRGIPAANLKSPTCAPTKTPSPAALTCSANCGNA